MKFCLLIPDRGDRPELTEFCLKQIKRFTVQPDKIYHINHRPDTERFDLIQRVHKGVSIAKAEGMDWVVMIENDDYYPANYLQKLIPFFEKYDFIGSEETTYYNLGNLTWKKFVHQYRSSLFTTAFKISALNNFEWPTENSPFLDIHLWKYAKYKRKVFIKMDAIGMKHQIGLCGGKGHVMRMQNVDADMDQLQSMVDPGAFEFYSTLLQKLKCKAA